MRLSIASVYIAPLLATLSGHAAAFSGDPQEVTQLKITAPNKKLGNAGKWQLSFKLSDPDPVTDTSTTCRASWTPGSPPSDYVSCADDDFGFRIKNFKGAQSFTIESLHSFTDPSVGDPPQDQVTTFGRGKVTPRNTQCGYRAGPRVCSQTKSPIELKIYAAIA